MKNFAFILPFLFLFTFQTKAQLQHTRYYNGGIFGRGYTHSNVIAYPSRVRSSSYSMGNYYLGIGNYDKAIQCYTKALNEPNYVSNATTTDIYYKRGYAKYQAQQFDDAIADFNIVIATLPTYAKAYNSKGLAEFYSGNYKAACADIEYAIKLEPYHAESYYFRSVLSYHFEDYKTAIAYCDTALMHNPKYTQALKRRANAKYITMDFEGAVTDYTKALKYDWTNARLYYSRGLAYSHLNKLDDAALDFYKAHTLDEHNEDYIVSLNQQTQANPNTTDKITRLVFSNYKD